LVDLIQLDVRGWCNAGSVGLLTWYGTVTIVIVSFSGWKYFNKIRSQLQKIIC